ARYGCLYHSHPLLLSILIQRAPPSTLFPYTTLFRSSVQQRIEVARRTPAGERSGALHRRLGAEDVADRQPLRAVDVHRVADRGRSEEHTSELQSRENLVCRLLLEKKNKSRRRLSIY